MRSQSLPTGRLFWFLEEDQVDSPSVVAVALGSSAASLGSLRAAATRALPNGSRLTRSRAGVVVALVPAIEGDMRQIAESARQRVADALGDPETAAGAGGPRDTAVGAHVAMLQAEHALVVGRAL